MICANADGEGVRGIIENATGRNTLMKSLKSSFVELVTHPHRFIAARPFRLIYVWL